MPHCAPPTPYRVDSEAKIEKTGQEIALIGQSTRRLHTALQRSGVLFSEVLFSADMSSEVMFSAVLFSEVMLIVAMFSEVMVSAGMFSNVQYSKAVMVK